MKCEKYVRPAVLFFLGGAVYCCIELLFRRRTHFSMFLLGGACVAAIDAVCNGWNAMRERALVLRAAVGGFLITLGELLCGLAVNVALGWNVWDYSHLPLNLFGQICPLFSAAWTVLAVPAIYFGRLVRFVLRGGKKRYIEMPLFLLFAL